MSTTIRHQVIRSGEECWVVHRYEPIDGAVHFEMTARVILDEGYYWVEWVKWEKETWAWERDTKRGYLLPKPALKIALAGKPPEVLS